NGDHRQDPRTASYVASGFSRTRDPSMCSTLKVSGSTEFPVATSTTSLNLRALLKTAISRSGMDVPAHAVSGLTPAAKAMFVAGAAQALPHGVVLYVVPTDGDLEDAASDVAFF